MQLDAQHLVQGPLQGGLAIGFAKEGGGLGRLGACQRRLVDIGTHKDDPNVQMRAYESRRLDAIHLTLEADIHQHQIRPIRQRLLDSLGTASDLSDHCIAQASESQFEVSRDEAFIFHNENMRATFHRPGIVISWVETLPLTLIPI
jgi:hypothetical protein